MKRPIVFLLLFFISLQSALSQVTFLETLTDGQGGIEGLKYHTETMIKDCCNAVNL